jgi:aminoglycoside phosphotransferase (APT) family kinase protein
MLHDLRAIAPHFQICGEFVSALPHGSGHIHDTYKVTCRRGSAEALYIFQRVNDMVFKNPPLLMENILRVTTHLREKLRAAGGAEIGRRSLEVIPTRDGAALLQDDAGLFWRAFVFIEGAQTYDTPRSTKHAFEAAKAFGQFQQMLTDLPAPRLHDTIPDFHHTPKRFENLERAIAADVKNRAAGCKAEIEFAMRHKAITSVLLDLHRAGQMPERITHNDTKINNVMVDDATGEGICVIDLDTVMPGLALYDFGDQVRTTTCAATEDERDLSKVEMQMPLFEALARGYLATAGSFLTKAEKEHLAFSGKLITFEIGLRFLTDYLSGDVYFKIHREGQNLDRCRTQFKLVESIARQEEAMRRVVQRGA